MQKPVAVLFHDYLGKPFDLDTLLRTVEQHVPSANRHQQSFSAGTKPAKWKPA